MPEIREKYTLFFSKEMIDKALEAGLFTRIEGGGIVWGGVPIIENKTIVINNPGGGNG